MGVRGCAGKAAPSAKLGGGPALYTEVLRRVLGFCMGSV